MNIKILFLIIICFLNVSLYNGQSFEIDQMYYHIFDNDSLLGFDEKAARATAVSEGYIGSEVKIKMYHLKREFIIEKYNLHKPTLLSNTNNYLNANRPTALTGCVNDDFEASLPGVVTFSNQVSGWTLNSGYNGNLSSTSTNTILQYYPGGLTGASSCNLLGCCPIPTMNSEIIDCSSPGGYLDNGIGSTYPIFSVFGTGTVQGATSTNTHIPEGLLGNNVLRINDKISGDWSIEKLSKSFLVTPTNSFYQYAFISVITPGHGCCDAGGFQIRLLNATTNATIPCSSFSVSAPSAQCANTTSIQYYISLTGAPYTSTSIASYIYSKWKLNSLDLSPYIGKTLTFDIVVTDCSAGGHFSYMYFDAECSALKININNTDFIAADSVITFKSCDSLATLKGPEKFNSYHWSGPSGINSNNAILTTSVSGIYTLTLNKASLCSPITKTVNLALDKSTKIVSANKVICDGETAILSVSGVNGGVWNTGSTSSSISISPSITTTYSYTAISPLGCLVSAYYSQKVNACTGIHTQNKSSEHISVYPNPNKGEFVIDIQVKFDKAILAIKSSLGQLVHKQAVQQGANTIKTEGLTHGIYYYTLSEKEKIIYKGKLQIE
jgi:hypothetical protein